SHSGFRQCNEPVNEVRNGSVAHGKVEPPEHPWNSVQRKECDVYPYQRIDLASATKRCFYQNCGTLSSNEAKLNLHMFQVWSSLAGALSATRHCMCNSAAIREKAVYGSFSGLLRGW